MKVINSNTMETKLSLDPVEDSVGIVVGDRDETESNMLRLFIPRLMMGIDIKDGKAKKETVNINTNKFVNSVNTNIGSNTITLQNYLEVPPYLVPGVNPPRYVKGERVKVEFADGDIKNPVYFPFQVHDVMKRKVDIMRYFVPSKSSEEDPLVDSNSYFIELNSRDKFIRLFSGKEDGEKAPFTFNINTKDGVVTFKDDTKRLFEWNYDEDKINIVTDGGCDFKLEQSHATLICETLDIKASNYINMETSKFRLKADTGDFLISQMYTENISHEHKSVNAKQLFTSGDLTTSKFVVTAPPMSYFVDSPMTVFTGIVFHPSFVMTKISAPPPQPSMYSGGAIGGATPGSVSIPTPSVPSVPSSAPTVTGGKMATAVMNGPQSKELAYVDPILKAFPFIGAGATAGGVKW